MIHITTASGPTEVITPGQIARGGGDAWLIGLNQAIAVTAMAHLRAPDGRDGRLRNPYSAFNADGSRRSADHSTAAYKAAWRRATLILRGGPRAAIDASLRGLGQPPLQGHGDLPAAPVAMQWVPQVAGAPDIAGNAPSDYFPGRRCRLGRYRLLLQIPQLRGVDPLLQGVPRTPVQLRGMVDVGRRRPRLRRYVLSLDRCPPAGAHADLQPGLWRRTVRAQPVSPGRRPDPRLAVGRALPGLGESAPH